jgi:hypothetical protein
MIESLFPEKAMLFFNNVFGTMNAGFVSFQNFVILLVLIIIVMAAIAISKQLQEGANDYLDKNSILGAASGKKASAKWSATKYGISLLAAFGIPTLLLAIAYWFGLLAGTIQ